MSVAFVPKRASLFYLDEYAESPKDLLSVLSVTGEWLLTWKKQSTLVEKNIDALAGLLQLTAPERVFVTPRHVGALTARPASRWSSR
jgi:hypothetical protein